MITIQLSPHEAFEKRHGYPACFTYGQWEEWSQAAGRGQGGKSGYCSDCTSQYQTQMVAEGRCGYPTTLFLVSEDDPDNIEGVRETRDSLRQRRSAKYRNGELV